MATSLQTLSLQVFGVGTGFVTAGAIIALSYCTSCPIKQLAFSKFNPLLVTVPIFLAHPNEVSLSHLRAVFSSGSHIFPQLATAASSAFSILAYNAPIGSSARYQYLLAATGTISIAPFTILVMKPTNMTLKEIGEQGEDGIKRSGGEQKVQKLLRRFGRLNAIRGGLLAFGAAVGLKAALSSQSSENL
ncbi:MAG: hypothetical protein L6R41_003620 [Letrouitia leprolyta]|nr:MAG: hypothetical protein L6R41_003620 [Letrouitia leprolyta]